MPTEYHDIVLLLCPRHVRSLVCRDPGMRLHNLCISAVDLDLSGLCIENRITAEEFLAHAFLHVLSDLIELRSHKGLSAYRSKILPVHNLRHMMGGDGAPMGNSRRTVLVSS